MCQNVDVVGPHVARPAPDDEPLALREVVDDGWHVPSKSSFVVWAGYVRIDGVSVVKSWSGISPRAHVESDVSAPWSAPATVESTAGCRPQKEKKKMR